MVIDIHCHPSLKSYLFEESMFSVRMQDENKPSRGLNILKLQSDLPHMKKGDVRGVITSHYIPEAGLRNESFLLDAEAGMMKIFWKELYKKIENEGEEQALTNLTLESIRIFEKKVLSAQMENENIALAYSYSEFEKLLTEGKIVFLHSVEGAHSLGRKLSGREITSVSPDSYLMNLDILFDKGVCMITLGHFYENDIVHPTEGIQPSIRFVFNKREGKDLSKGLTPVGEAVVRRMIERGILIDLVHSTPAARKRVFEINNEFGDNKRPVIFSHSGVQKLFVNDKYPEDMYYNPDDEEILKVRDCNGVIGLVFMNYWLSGKEEKFLAFEPGMEYLFNTIHYIYKLTGSYDNIAIGSDFDAMNNPSDDIYNHSFMPDLIGYLERQGIASGDIDKIMNANARRILKEGWGK